MALTFDFNQQEIDFLSDKSILLKKRALLERLDQAFFQVGKHCLSLAKTKLHQLKAHPDSPLTTKLTKGENLEGQAYRVMDCPGLFTKDGYFALRIIFIWGHYFTFELLLSGSFLNFLKPNNLNTLPNETLFATTKDPWKHFIHQTDYQKISELNKNQIFEHLQKNQYLKLKSLLPLKSYAELPSFCSSSTEAFLTVLEWNK